MTAEIEMPLTYAKRQGESLMNQRVTTLLLVYLVVGSQGFADGP
jgi:hypothetical protein